MAKKKILVFTGAGISRESGLQTFRDSDGLWEGCSVEDVCTPMAWAKDPQRVLDFYNNRRKDVLAAEPNAAHKALVELEEHYDVSIVTQNIDDLHERAGSSNVLHLHGEIFQARNEYDDTCENLIPWTGDMMLGDLDENGKQLRPHVVFFGEGIFNWLNACDLTFRTRILIVCGTSLQVYPAAGLVGMSNADDIYIVDPNAQERSYKNAKMHYVKEAATVGLPQVVKELIDLEA